MEWVQGLENIVMKEPRCSYMVQVCGEDPVYVAGYFVDVRGLRVSNELTRFQKDKIALRIKVGDEAYTLPGPDQLTFDHHTNDYAGA